MIRAIAASFILLALLACGAQASPAQQTADAVAEQTKTWESTRDKAHRGHDEEERIAGDHCLLADDEIHPAFPLAELIKAEIANPDTFHAVLGKDDQDETFPALFLYRLDGSDVKKFDIPMSEIDIENIKAGGRITPLTHRVRVPAKYSGVWTDRPKHYAEFDFRTENSQSMYEYWKAYAFVDHWTCEVRLLDIVPNT